MIIFSGVYLLDMVAPMTSLSSSSLLEIPFTSSSYRVSSSVAVNEKDSNWDDQSTTDTEGESLQPNMIRNRPRALSV